MRSPPTPFWSVQPSTTLWWLNPQRLNKTALPLAAPSCRWQPPWLPLGAAGCSFRNCFVYSVGPKAVNFGCLLLSLFSERIWRRIVLYSRSEIHPARSAASFKYSSQIWRAIFCRSIIKSSTSLSGCLRSCRNWNWESNWPIWNYPVRMKTVPIHYDSTSPKPQKTPLVDCTLCPPGELFKCASRTQNS